MQENIERHFVWIIIIFAGAALLIPNLFVGMKPFIPIGLGLIMFGIGINIPMSCLTRTVANPKTIIVLVGLRYITMPFCAYLIACGLHLTQAETIGLLVLGTAPGGTAANVMAYLSKSNVALALLLTFGSTLLSPLVTPALIYVLLNQHVTIHFWAMITHISSIVLLPIAGGLLLNHFKLPVLQKIKSMLPVCSIFLVSIIIACICALNQPTLMTFPVMAMIAAISLNLLGYFVGATIAYFMRQDKSSILATTFDYGMFDAVVAIVICTTFFSKEAAIPAVLISIIQNLTAPIIVRYQTKTERLLPFEMAK